MIERSPIIPIHQQLNDTNEVDADLLDDMYEVRSPKYLLDLAMCYVDLKITMEKTPPRHH